LEPFVNRELSFGGVVTDVQHRVSKMGKGWASFTVEDYTDSFEFRIYGEEYLKYRHFLVKSSFVYIKVFVREGWLNKETQQKGEARLQFTSFQLLHDVMDNFAKKLSIQLDVKKLDPDLIRSLQELMAIHEGNHPINFIVYDNDEQLKLSMPSRKQKVKISHELLNELANIDVFYKLN